MRSALLYVEGVECAHVDLAGECVTVACEGPCDRSALLAALERKGYGGTFR